MAASDPQASDHSAREFCMDTNCILRDTEKNVLTLHPKCSSRCM